MTKLYRWILRVVLTLSLTSCATALFTIGKLSGQQQPFQSDYPWESITFASEQMKPGITFPKNTSFAIAAKQKGEVANVMKEHFAKALSSKDFKITSEKEADYLLEPAYHEKDGVYPFYDYIQVKVYENTSEKTLVWEATAYAPPYNGSGGYNKEYPLLSTHRPSTMYGDYDYLQMDYPIAVITRHFGETVPSSYVRIHPAKFKYLSKN